MHARTTIFIICAAIAAVLLPPSMRTTAIQSAFGAEQLFYLSLVSSTSFPEVGERVRVEARSFSANLDTLTIVWKQDGQETLRGRGKTTYEFTMGPQGSETAVEATVILDDGSVRRIQKSFAANVVYLLWEAETITPSWYQGKALPGPGSMVTVWAIPEIYRGGARRDPRTLDYRWKLDGKTFSVDDPKSGVMRFHAGKLSGKHHVIDVVVRDGTGTALANGSATLRVVSPEARFYREDALMGIMERALTEARIAGGERAAIRVEPFYFDRAVRKILTFAWTVNNDAIKGEFDTPTRLRLETAAGETLTTNAAVRIKNPSSIFQELLASLPLHVE